MNVHKWFSACLVLALVGVVSALEDPGRTQIGLVGVTVYHATDTAPKKSGAKYPPVPKEVADRLRGEECLRFKYYTLLGQDTQPLLRSYESWAQPLKPSDEVLVRFEAQGRPTKKSAVIDLELWLARKKIMKTVACLEGRKPLFVLGPEYRGGRLIIAVALATAAKPAP